VVSATRRKFGFAAAQASLALLTVHNWMFFEQISGVLDWPGRKASFPNG
jgi:hypothetical protein